MSGVLRCDKHGRNIPLHACVHVKKSLVAAKPIEVYHFPVFLQLVCAKCYSHAKGSDIENMTLDDLIDNPESDHLFDVYEELYEQINMSLICPKCIDLELIKK